MNHDLDPCGPWGKTPQTFGHPPRGRRRTPGCWCPRAARAKRCGSRHTRCWPRRGGEEARATAEAATAISAACPQSCPEAEAEAAPEAAGVWGGCRSQRRRETRGAEGQPQRHGASLRRRLHWGISASLRLIVPHTATSTVNTGFLETPVAWAAKFRDVDSPQIHLCKQLMLEPELEPASDALHARA